MNEQQHSFGSPVLPYPPSPSQQEGFGHRTWSAMPDPVCYLADGDAGTQCVIKVIPRNT